LFLFSVFLLHVVENKSRHVFPCKSFNLFLLQTNPKFMSNFKFFFFFQVHFFKFYKKEKGKWIFQEKSTKTDVFLKKHKSTPHKNTRKKEANKKKSKLFPIEVQKLSVCLLQRYFSFLVLFEKTKTTATHLKNLTFFGLTRNWFRHARWLLNLPLMICVQVSE